MSISRKKVRIEEGQFELFSLWVSMFLVIKSVDTLYIGTMLSFLHIFIIDFDDSNYGIIHISLKFK